MGLPKEQLTRAEQKQVKESNILVFKTAEALNTQHALGKAYGLENPDHQVGKPSLWLMPHIKAILDKKDVIEVNFDQCRVGLHTTKPTKLLLHLANLPELADLRCNYPKKEWTKADGTKYRAPHESVVQSGFKVNKVEKGLRSLKENIQLNSHRRLQRVSIPGSQVEHGSGRSFARSHFPETSSLRDTLRFRNHRRTASGKT